MKLIMASESGEWIFFCKSAYYRMFSLNKLQHIDPISS